ncbi:MAG: hypothetical protein E7497_06900 [Ruminococcus sp.]|nr:hypothetical protein [Ruminococcus sp.]
MASKSLHSGHRERLRKRFLETGINGFEEHELLELLLFYALPRVNTNEIAHAIINKFGGISEVLDADRGDIASIKGLSENSAVLLRIMRDMCRDYAAASSADRHFSGMGEAEAYLLDYFRPIRSEICVIMNVSMRCELVGLHCFTHEELLPEYINPRNLAEIVLRNRIRRIVIGQNRMGRLPLPDENDYIITKTLSELLSPLGVEIYDHIICGEGKAFSMRKSGAFSFRTGDFDNG